MLCWGSCCPVQRIDNIKQPIYEKQFDNIKQPILCLLFLEIIWLASFLMEGGATVPHPTRTPEGARVARGDRGAGLQLKT